MICVTINIYGGTPVRSWFTKKTTEKLFFHELISTFSLSYLSLTFASIIGADGTKSILYSCTKNWIYTKFTQWKFGAKKCKLRLNKGQRW